MPKSKKKATEEVNEDADTKLPVRKRKKGDDEEEEEGDDKKPRGRPKGSKGTGLTEGAMELGMAAAQALSVPPGGGLQMPPMAMAMPLPATTQPEEADLKPIERGPMPKAREVRLEQNRKAARESRRRKKTMIEELQRSVMFFSRTNATLKQQNDEFQRLLIQAQAQIAQLEANGGAAKDGEGGSPTEAAVEGTQNAAAAGTDAPAPVDPQAAAQAVAAAQAAQAQFQLPNIVQAQQAAQAQAAAMQATYERQGFPPAAARAAAQTFTATTDGSAASTDGAQQPQMVFDAQAMMAMQQQMMANPALFQQQWQMMQQAAAPPNGSAPAAAADASAASAPGDSTNV
eukprot:CAMPEP_0178481804 /NCGR_PEP_ID=MMETSP0696-20121128/6403_1 /TAXON_ID=265572 /ORGANISM="Extubocellulus spinifer, Strain CCMP396" /LENGTH=343 /DNA_ID=CAMNT_0020109293 /DNA_START=585 /DNA_END=1616 /DNA_ORIENTATION=+